MSAETKYFRPGQFLFREGEPSESMFVIQKGTVAIRKMKGGGYVDLARVHQNEVVGELSFFDRRARSAAAIALTECEALEIDFNSLDLIYKKMPGYFKTILVCVAERLRKANETVRRLQKHLIDEDEGVIGREVRNDEDDDTLALLDAVEESENVTQPSEKPEDILKEFEGIKDDDE